MLLCVLRNKRLATDLTQCCRLCAKAYNQRLVAKCHVKWVPNRCKQSAADSPQTQDSSQSVPPDLQYEDQSERYSGETSFSMPKSLVVKPIESIVIKDKIEKVVKYESFVERLFLGEFDKDFLNFPILLKNKKEYIEMSNQYEMIRRMYFKLRKDRTTLESLAFYSLHQLSISEMVYAMEAVGASEQNNLSFGNISPEDRKILNPDNTIKSVSFLENQLTVEPLKTNKTIIETITPLVIHNAMSYYAINNSSNEVLKQEILANNPKIGFAYCEPNESLGSLPYIHWETEAKLTNDLTSWVVNGSKGRIFKDDYDYYLLFCRTQDFPEQMGTERQNQFGIVTLLVPKELLIIEDDGIDSYGVEYLRIRVQDLLLSRDKFELIKSEQSATQALNVKACGQIAVSAVVLGLLKQLLRNTYDFVINERIGLSECEIIQKILSESTRKIYAIESMLYMTAAMFDSFEAGYDCSLEAITVKTLTTEYAFDVIKNLRSIYGSRYLVSSTAHDLINVFDSFLDCSTNNRMYLALRGLRMAGQWRHDHIRRLRLSPLYPVHAVKNYLGAIKRRRDLIDFDLDLSGYVHPNLQSAAEWIETCVKKFDLSGEQLLTTYGKVFI